MLGTSRPTPAVLMHASVNSCFGECVIFFVPSTNGKRYRRIRGRVELENVGWKLKFLYTQTHRHIFYVYYIHIYIIYIFILYTKSRLKRDRLTWSALFRIPLGGQRRGKKQFKCVKVAYNEAHCLGTTIFVCVYVYIIGEKRRTTRENCYYYHYVCLRAHARGQKKNTHNKPR